jgi:gamma-glutamyltranspeptidase/glutathione hydrolase
VRRFMCMLLSAALLSIGHVCDAQQTRQINGVHRTPVYAPHGIIATSQPLASTAGLAVLQRGGNAVDAAVTAAAVLGVLEPMMTGIGSDLFALVWVAKEHKLIALNASGRAGTRMTRAALLERGYRDMPQGGAESITVPGALGGWAALLGRYGTIDLRQALQPAIKLADEGFPVPLATAAWWRTGVERLKRDEGARSTFLVGGERAPEAGEWFRNADLATTLRAIARDGPNQLYGGELGGRIAAHLEKLGGFVTLEDLRQNRVEWVEPISTTFRGYRVWEMPPNSQGIAALEMLRILEPYDLAHMGHNSAAYLHHLIEAKKLAFTDVQRFVADADRMSVGPGELLSDKWIAERRRSLNPDRADQPMVDARLPERSETTYLTVADADGNVVSLISSLFQAFGSAVVVPHSGFALQNRGSGFTLAPNHPNTVLPGKRPFHTNMPGFVTRQRRDAATGKVTEEPWLSFGVIGGPVQPQGQVQVLLNLIVFGMNVQEAIDAPRFIHSATGAQRGVALESAISDSIRAQLRQLGHELPTNGSNSFFGGGQAVMRLERGWVAGSDSRLDGAAVGH